LLKRNQSIPLAFRRMRIMPIRTALSDPPVPPMNIKLRPLPAGFGACGIDRFLLGRKSGACTCGAGGSYRPFPSARDDMLALLRHAAFLLLTTDILHLCGS